MRQESRFIAAAQSNVGANGLMQIMPATAKWIAKQLEIDDFKPEKFMKLKPISILELRTFVLY